MPPEPEALQPDLAAEERPRYLRRQKPVEVKRRRFGRRSLQLYKRIAIGSAAALVSGFVLYVVWDFVANSARLRLVSVDQIELGGNHYVARATVLEKFVADQGRSVLRVPLDARRHALEELPWVERASVERILPNRVRVELVERTPVAFLRQGTGLALIDAYGVILDPPMQGGLRFPVVTGIGENIPREEREQRMKLYVEFLKDIEMIRPGAADQVSEVDLSDAKDVRAVLAGVPGTGLLASENRSPVLVHFGDSDFVNKFRLYVENIAQWRASAGRVESVDLRYARQVVVNPESKATAARRNDTASKAR